MKSQLTGTLSSQDHRDAKNDSFSLILLATITQVNGPEQYAFEPQRHI